MVGFAWRSVPIVSQYKTVAALDSHDDFTLICERLLREYERELEQSKEEVIQNKSTLEAAGCEKIFIAPDCIGHVKLKAIDLLLSQLIDGSVLMVPSWEHLGTHSFVLQCLRASIEERVYIITPEHKALIYIPEPERARVHRSWVENSVRRETVGNPDTREQVLDMLRSGHSAADIQQTLGISRSAYYRYAKSELSIALLLKQYVALRAQGHTGEQIMEELSITEDTYFELIREHSRIEEIQRNVRQIDETVGLNSSSEDTQ
jgi:hypothetical protein